MGHYLQITLPYCGIRVPYCWIRDGRQSGRDADMLTRKNLTDKSCVKTGIRENFCALFSYRFSTYVIMNFKKKAVFTIVFCLTTIIFISCNLLDELQDDITEHNYKKQQKDLDKKFDAQWSQEEKEHANTAINESYLNSTEKEVYYYLNLARINPPLFGKTYASAYKVYNIKGYAYDERKESLLKELEKLDSMPVLKPDRLLFESADCFATNGGKQGLIGHDRSSTGCMKLNVAECCHYSICPGGLEIVMSLLIDSGENNGALGHRRICLSSSYHYLGVAIRDHKKYDKNAVLDFSREKME